MKPEDRLRDAIHDYTDSVEPADAWGRIRERTAQRQYRWPMAIAGLATAVVIALVVAVVTVRDDNGGGSNVVAEPSAAQPTQVVALTDDGRVVILDTATGAEVLTVSEGAEIVDGTRLAVHPEGHTVYFTRAVSSDGCDPELELQLVGAPIDGGDPEIVVGGSRFPTVSPDGQWIAYAIADPCGAGLTEIGLTNLVTGEHYRPEFLGKGELSARPLVWTPDSQALLYRHYDGGAPLATYELSGLPLPVVSNDPPFYRGLDSRSTPAFLSDGTIATTDPDEDVIVVETVRGQDVLRDRALFELPAADARALDHILHLDSSGGNLLATDATTGALYRWMEGDGVPTKVADGVVAAIWAPGPANPPPGQIAAATEDGRVVVLDSATGAEIRTLATGGATTVAVTPDGRRVIFSRPSTAASDPPSEIATVPVSGGDVERLLGGAGQPAISPDGQLLAFTRYEQLWPGNHQPRSIHVVELASMFDDRPANVIATGEIAGDGASVLALSWSPDSRQLLYTVVGTLDGNPPRVIEVAEEMVLDQAPAIPGVIEANGCAEATHLGDTGLVLSVRRRSAVAIEPANGQEVRRLFDAPQLNCVTQAPASDRTGGHVLYAADGDLYVWRQGQSGPTHLAEGIAFASWVPSPQ